MGQYDIPQKTLKFMHHDMIEKYANLPQFPYERTRLLQAFLSEGILGETHVNDLYATVTSLVQLGMDTHDGVENEDSNEDLALTRKKQMRVLAGDFFSARFYQLLAQHGKIEIIRRLSAAICEVNRLKLNLYERTSSLRITAEEYVQTKVAINSELFRSFTPIMEGKYKEKWPAILHAFTRSEVLLEQLKRLYDQRLFSGSWGYWYLLEVADAKETQKLKSDQYTAHELSLLIEKYELQSTITAKLQAQIEKYSRKIDRLSSKGLLTELQAIGERLFKLMPGPNQLDDTTLTYG